LFVFLAKYYYGVQTNERMNGTCGTYRREERSIKIFIGHQITLSLFSAISHELSILYVYGKQIKLCSFLFKYLALLYDGACVLFITGLIGSFIYVLLYIERVLEL